MRESTFIDRNRSKWKEMEDFEKTDPDETASDFVEIISDLSYAQTRYPHSKINSYLNHLAVTAYRAVYRNKKPQPLLEFWKTTFPLILGENRRILWLASAFFLAFCTLGAVCADFEPEFVESVMGREYIAMTEENIAKGEPFGVYAKEEPFKMFLSILANNLFVGLLVFISGIFMGIGSVYHTFKNAIMVGSFFHIFFRAHLGLNALVVIGLHGTLELMSLVLECMAGMILGLSALFPGTLTRRQAFRKGLNQAALIYIGTIPFTLIAAFIESYVTRYGSDGLRSDNPMLTLLLLLVFLLSWVILIWYFFIYSRRVARRNPNPEYRNKPW
ncbi:MAG: stage II sporulation protein M [Leadbetterella sp.]|nr:stage II sporulation protein M [Leadbetterella sp.]